MIRRSVERYAAAIDGRYDSPRCSLSLCEQNSIHEHLSDSGPAAFADRSVHAVGLEIKLGNRISRTRNSIKSIMRAVETFITSGSPEVVWRVLADVEHWRDWTPTIIEIKALNGTGLKVGAKYRVVQPKLRPATYEVTEYVPNRRFTWVQRVAGGAMIADHRIAAAGGATKVELSFASKGLLANIIGNLFSRIIRDYVTAEAKGLKKRCDNLALEKPSE